jgi:hypothetical protein
MRELQTAHTEMATPSRFVHRQLSRVPGTSQETSLNTRDLSEPPRGFVLLSILAISSRRSYGLTNETSDQRNDCKLPELGNWGAKQHENPA